MIRGVGVTVHLTGPHTLCRRAPYDAEGRTAARWLQATERLPSDELTFAGSFISGIPAARSGGGGKAEPEVIQCSRDTTHADGMHWFLVIVSTLFQSRPR